MLLRWDAGGDAFMPFTIPNQIESLTGTNGENGEGGSQGREKIRKCRKYGRINETSCSAESCLRSLLCLCS